MFWRLTLRVVTVIAVLIPVIFGSTDKPFSKPATVKAAGMFEASDFGAKGDGVTDDSKALRLAVAAAAAAGGGTVSLEKGVFIVSGFIDVPNGVSITGQGMTDTTLK